MRAAARPPKRRDLRRVVWLDETGHATLRGLDALQTELGPEDVLVVNDAATLPASLVGEVISGSVTGDRVPLEARLMGSSTTSDYEAILFGEGSFRTRTEDRTLPPRLAVGARLAFGAGRLSCRVLEVSPSSPRRVTLRFDGSKEAVLEGIFAVGRPIQYAHIEAPLALWDVQTIYAGRPWAMEMPSAGHPLSYEMLRAVLARGVRVVPITVGSGISSTGDAAIDAHLPLGERVAISRAAQRTIHEARERGGRIVAVGTSVVRGLESYARSSVRDEDFETITHWLADRDTELMLVDGLLTGMHVDGTSHFRLLEAFAPRRHLRRFVRLADALGLLEHEFGDLLFLPTRARAKEARLNARARSETMRACKTTRSAHL